MKWCGYLVIMKVLISEFCARDPLLFRMKAGIFTSGRTIMSCQSCGSLRIGGVCQKCHGDVSVSTPDGRERMTEPPDDVGIGDGGYIEFEWCLECGQIQGSFPIGETEEEEGFRHV